MDILKTIVEKLKLKELCAILFIATTIITFMPEKWAQLIKIETFREAYQTYISLCMIAIGSYYLLQISQFIGQWILGRIINRKKIALKYMKEDMSTDEMQLLIEVFYDETNKCFHTTGQIDLNDGRKAALESKHIIYRSAQVSSFYTMFAYNLQPYALEFLNKNLKEGNIELRKNSFKYDLK